MQAARIDAASVRAKIMIPPGGRRPTEFCTGMDIHSLSGPPQDGIEVRPWPPRAARRFASSTSGMTGAGRIDRKSLAHIPAKACPGLDPGWAPVRRQGHAPMNNSRARPDSVGTGRALVSRAPVQALSVEPRRSGRIERIDLGTFEPGHVRLDGITDLRLQVGEVAIAFG